MDLFHIINGEKNEWQLLMLVILLLPRKGFKNKERLLNSNILGSYLGPAIQPFTTQTNTLTTIA